MSSQVERAANLLAEEKYEKLCARITEAQDESTALAAVVDSSADELFGVDHNQRGVIIAYAINHKKYDLLKAILDKATPDHLDLHHWKTGYDAMCWAIFNDNSKAQEMICAKFSDEQLQGWQRSLKAEGFPEGFEESMGKLSPIVNREVEKRAALATGTIRSIEIGPGQDVSEHRGR